MWKYKLCVADTVVSNSPCRVKRIVLYYAGATTALIFNEADGSFTAGNRVWTLTSSATIPRDEIDFGIEGAFFHLGCAINWTAGEVLVVYKL